MNFKHEVFDHFNEITAMSADEIEALRLVGSEEGVPLPFRDIVFALVLTGANLGRVARILNVRRARVRDLVARVAELQVIVVDIVEAKIDNVEEEQFNAAMSGDTASGRFILQTVAKNRGYSTRMETTGKDGVPLSPPSIDFAKLSTEALKELKGSIAKSD